MRGQRENLVDQLYYHMVRIISETNGLSLENTLELLVHSPELDNNDRVKSSIEEFQELVARKAHH